MFSAFAIANFFIQKSLEDKRDLSPMKLQKLVYFAHGWHLAMYKKPLIDEIVEAWKFGPVIPSLYNEFKSYGNSNINKLYQDFWGYVPKIENQEIIKFLESIWDLYAEFSAIQLSNATHEAGSPWYQTVTPYLKNQGFIPKNKDIDDEVIAAFFSEKLNAIGAQ